MEPIHALISMRVTSEQLERMRHLHPRLVIHGEPGGIAIMQASEVDHKGIEYPEERPDLDIPTLLSQAEVLIATRVPSYLADRAPNLRWIQFTTAGVDFVWKPFLDRGRIVVTSAKGVHVIPMAEFVLSCMLMFAKGWPRLIQQQRDHRYEQFLVEELYEKTVVLIGVGEIGRAIARASKQLGMHVIGIRRQEGAEGTSRDFDEVVAISNINEVLNRGDFVVASLPLTPKTDRLLNKIVFQAMRPSAVFLNVGRGKTVDETALVQALREGWIRGAALDVYEHEPLPPDSPLWDMRNALLCPHISCDTVRYTERMTDLLCDNLWRYAEGQPLRNVVDPIERY